MPARGAKQGPSLEPAAHQEDPSVLCQFPLLPALHAGSLATEASWLLSSMLSWEGGMGYRDSYSKLLGTSTSAILRVLLGHWRGSPVESYHP